MTIYEQAREYRKELLEGEMEAQGRLYAAYAESYKSALSEIQSVTKQIADAQRDGKRVPKTWLAKEGRLKRVVEGLAKSSADFAPKATGIVTLAQGRALQQAARHSKALADLGRQGEGQTRESLALRQAVGFLKDGSPVREALERNGKLAGRKAARVLRNGIAKGESADTIAKNLKAVAGIPAVRAATIARTETMRAYNEATLETYRANSDAFDGYIRIEVLDSRTCALCWALHGEVSALMDDPAVHPNCRATFIPKRIGQESTIERGANRFERRTDEQKKATLGPGTFALYQDGQIGIDAIVKRVNDPSWGPQIKRVPLADLVGA